MIQLLLHLDTNNKGVLVLRCLKNRRLKQMRLDQSKQRRAQHKWNAKKTLPM